MVLEESSTGSQGPQRAVGLMMMMMTTTTTQPSTYNINLAL
jgi:hypothetical protein